eukprot:2678723-Prymnesium_polylepis.1
MANCVEACLEPLSGRRRGFSSINTREAFLEQQVAELKRQNEALKQQVAELQQSPHSPLLPLRVTKQGSSARSLLGANVDPSADAPQLDKTHLAEINVAAAAEWAAEYQRSLVNVLVDNEMHEVATWVTVR